jgi:putative heme-binding domain-containing protein
MLAAFLNRTGGAEALASALRTSELQPATAKQLLRALFSTGHSDQAILDTLNQAIGASAATPDYSEAYVKRLLADASRHGEAERGAVLFKSLACVSCHQVGGVGGVIGPNLTAIGTTLSAERIVEELLWPHRQIKEGYSVVRVITVEGKIHQGYERRTKESQESGDLIVQDLATQKLITIKKRQIDEQQVAGSPMPSGLTALLSRQQLLDLIQFLSELGRIK